MTTIDSAPSPILGYLNPINKTTPETPVDKSEKVKNIASKSLKKEKKKESTKKFSANVWNKFCNFIKKVFSCICKFFCFCCPDDDSSSGYGSGGISDGDISISDPLDEVEDFFQEIYKGKIPEDVEFKLNELGLKKTKDPLNLAKDIKFRKDRFKLLQATAQNIGTRLASRLAPKSFILGGQPNPDNRCYMNSILQALETLYWEDPKTRPKVIYEDLSLQPGETMERLEERLLKSWAPIPKIDDFEKTELSLQLLNKKDEYSKLKEKSSSETLREECKNEIILLKKRLRNREDRILFKWSYLLVVQAKFKGTSEDINNALKFFHNVCFGLALHEDFKTGEREQKDAAAFREYFNDMLGIVDCPVAMQRVSHFDGKVICTKIKTAQESILQIEMNEAKELIQFIGNKFLEKKTDNHNDKCLFKLPNKKKVSLATYNVISRISSAPPECLTFHFKRFSCKFENNRLVRKKILDPLPVNWRRDLKLLDFSPFFRKSSLGENKALYQLKSFTVHAWGSIDFGHYVEYVKRSDGKWYYCNDTAVSEINESDLPLQDAYMMDFKLIKSL